MYEYNLALRFEMIVRQFSNKQGIKFSKNSFMTYAQINSKANQLAKYFLDKNLSKNDVICISGRKRFNSFVGIIASLKIGAIYVILDPDSPVKRLRKIISTCEPKLILGEKELINKLNLEIEEFNISFVPAEEQLLNDAIKIFDENNLKRTKSVLRSDPAYIMYTSGSTGFPKGAVITHGGLLNLIEWCKYTFEIKGDDVLTNLNPLYFDNTVFDFYASLFNGACLVPFTKKETSSPNDLLMKIDDTQCTSWFSVPSLLIYLQTMRAVMPDKMKTIKKIIFGGEGYPKGKLKELFDIYSHRIDFYNVYGPTECTCMCSSYLVTEDDFIDLQGFPPLGEIAENFGYLILNENMNKVSDGEVGELYLLGPNVGLGYYNDPVRTNERFIQNPYNQNYNEIMYNTGDLVLKNPDDEKIHIRGRVDHQIKHMGYRIELEEIENAFSSLSYIDQAVVVHGELNGLSQIVAVIKTNNSVQRNEIKKDLRLIIPNYMIPAIIHFVDTIPKNANGKIDRRKTKELYLKREGVKNG